MSSIQSGSRTCQSNLRGDSLRRQRQGQAGRSRRSHPARTNMCSGSGHVRGIHARRSFASPRTPDKTLATRIRSGDHISSALEILVPGRLENIRGHILGPPLGVKSRRQRLHPFGLKATIGNRQPTLSGIGERHCPFVGVEIMDSANLPGMPRQPIRHPTQSDNPRGDRITHAAVRGTDDIWIATRDQPSSEEHDDSSPTRLSKRAQQSAPEQARRACRVAREMLAWHVNPPWQSRHSTPVTAGRSHTFTKRAKTPEPNMTKQDQAPKQCDLMDCRVHRRFQEISPENSVDEMHPLEVPTPREERQNQPQLD